MQTISFKIHLYSLIELVTLTPIFIAQKLTSDQKIEQIKTVNVQQFQ